MLRKTNLIKNLNTPKILLPIFFLLLFISNSSQNIFARSKEFKNKRIINKSVAKFDQKIHHLIFLLNGLNMKITKEIPKSLRKETLYLS